MTHIKALLYGMLCFTVCGICAWGLITWGGPVAQVCVVGFWLSFASAMVFTMWGFFGSFEDRKRYYIVVDCRYESPHQLPETYIEAPVVARTMNMPGMYFPAEDVPERWVLVLLSERCRIHERYFDTDISQRYPSGALFP